jgi:hypothetical protein
MGQSRRAMSTIPWDREGIPGVSCTATILPPCQRPLEELLLKRCKHQVRIPMIAGGDSD